MRKPAGVNYLESWDLTPQKNLHCTEEKFRTITLLSTLQLVGPEKNVMFAGKGVARILYRGGQIKKILDYIVLIV
jgi:hypothetical protein